MTFIINRGSIICFVFLLFVFTLRTDGAENQIRQGWHLEKENHRGAELSLSQLEHLNEIGDMTLFRQILEPLLLPRIVGTPNHDIVRNHIVKSMRDLDWDVEESSFLNDTPNKKDVKFTNIIATLDKNATRRLVLACHYDSKDMGNKVFEGATDSSVPCAQMIHLATVLDQHLKTHRNLKADLTLQLLFFDGEEAFVKWTATDSIYGSRYMANRLENTPYPPNSNNGLNELDRIDLFVLLDLIGHKNTKFRSLFQNTHNWYESMKSIEEHFSIINRDNRVQFTGSQLFYSGIEDDHIPFLRKGVRILHLISVPFPPVWHKVSDNRKNLDYDVIDNLNKVLRGFVAHYLHLFL